MNIILLSGGSGERLWPLSNNIRSKQFIKLFKDGDKHESMLQRVYHQIKKIDKDASVTIATSKTQVPAIKNQLEDNVSLCVEPIRRDTFPAIALASLYLHDVLKVKENEPVVVCPVDPYVNDSYFESIKDLSKIVDKANLSLMGIEPTYPSEKYGYIIPNSKDKLSSVKEFKEKPDRATAEKYLQQGAVWNAGIFAFKLSYMLEKSEELLNCYSYQQLYDNYDKAPKISYDYAVAEKEDSINVLRYKGEWRDVGTWNMMSEVMSDKVLGKATLDKATTNTNVINELDIPILVMGAHNMVVAASNDGILVSDKEQSGYMKPYVQKIATEARYADKSWGSFKIINAESTNLTAKLVIKADHSLSYHSHKYREEILTVLDGNGILTINGEQSTIKTGDVIKIKPEVKHKIYATNQLTLLETQIGSEISSRDKIVY